MIFIICLPVAVALLHITQLPHFITALSLSMQNFCALKTPAIQYSSLLSATVCGTDLNPSPLLSVLLASQLYHIAVVSGSHLQVLVFFYKSLPSRVSKQTLVICVLLFWFCIMTGFQAPILKAFLNYLASTWTKAKGSYLPQDLLCLVSGIICLMIFPKWIDSFSLFLSWWAGLCLCLANLFFSVRSVNLKKYLLTIVLVQIAMGFALGIITGYGILANALLAPIFGFALFPLGILSYTLPGASFLFDKATAALLFCLNQMAGNDPIAWTHHSHPHIDFNSWLGIAMFSAVLRGLTIFRMRETCT